MGNTADYRELGRRFSSLRKSLLPPKFNPTGTYTDAWLDRTRGYLLLTHAETEHYLETVVKKLVTRQVAEWQNHRRATSVLLALTLSFKLAWSIGRDADFEAFSKALLSERKIDKSVTELVVAANTQFHIKVRENHGIKEENLKTLLIPIGFDMTQLDPSLLIEMENFGRIRGENAHQSGKVVALLDPKTEYDRVDGIYALLRPLDASIYELLR